MNEDELIVSLDVENLYTNVKVEEAIEVSIKELYSRDEIPEISRSAVKSLLRLAVTNIHFKCNKMWYTQSDVLAMGAPLSVILVNICMKSVENFLQKPDEGRQNKTLIISRTCIDCSRRVVFRMN